MFVLSQENYVKIVKKLQKAVVFLILVTFSVTINQPFLFAQSNPSDLSATRLPEPGVLVHLSQPFKPARLIGMTVHPDNGLEFDFLIYQGDQVLKSNEKKEEYQKLIKYFLASLTIPDQDQWVNLSPYEKNRIIKDDFGKTEMGRDLLAEDYMLKQITSSLIYPEEGLGKKFWEKVYDRAWREYHTTDVAVNTFNKVWIIPDHAVVYENNNSAYILNSHLKVMLEEDYLSLNKHNGIENKPQKTHTIGSQVIREIILPEIEHEVNEGKNFAQLRQMFSGMILATWFKNSLKNSLLGKIYANKTKTAGVRVEENVKNQSSKALNVDHIYQQYLKAFKKGVYNYIKEDVDKYTKQTIPRKYFSGGWKSLDSAMVIKNRSQFRELSPNQLGIIINTSFGIKITPNFPNSNLDLTTARILKISSEDFAMSEKAYNIIKPHMQELSKGLENNDPFSVRLLTALYAKSRFNTYPLSPELAKVFNEYGWITKNGNLKRDYKKILRRIIKVNKNKIVLTTPEFYDIEPIDNRIPEPGLVENMVIAATYETTNLIELLILGLIQDDIQLRIITTNKINQIANSRFDIRKKMRESKEILDLLSSNINNKIVFKTGVSKTQDEERPYKERFTTKLNELNIFSINALISLYREIEVPDDLVTFFEQFLDSDAPFVQAAGYFLKEHRKHDVIQHHFELDLRQRLRIPEGADIYSTYKKENFDDAVEQAILACEQTGGYQIRAVDGEIFVRGKNGEKILTDSAMKVFETNPSVINNINRLNANSNNPGGIDLNGANLKMDLIKNGNHSPVGLSFSNTDMAQLSQAEGFIPDIIEIKPVSNIPVFHEIQQKLQTINS